MSAQKENLIKDVAAAVLSGRVNAASSSGGLRVGRGHHVSSRLLGYPCFSVSLTTVGSLCPAFKLGVRASATLGRPRVANGPTCLSASRHLCSDPSRGSSLSRLFLRWPSLLPPLTCVEGGFVRFFLVNSTK